MQPTLYSNNILICNKAIKNYDCFKRNDIVIAIHPYNPTSFICKREIRHVPLLGRILITVLMQSNPFPSFQDSSPCRATSCWWTRRRLTTLPTPRQRQSTLSPGQCGWKVTTDWTRQTPGITGRCRWGCWNRKWWRECGRQASLEFFDDSNLLFTPRASYKENK